MARKKGKKSTRERQVRQQRRAAKSRKRKERAGRSPQSRDHSRPDEIIEDMLPLFPLLEDGASSSDTDMDQFMMLLLDSADLIEEPEFEEIIIDPMHSMETFAEVAQELDIDPGVLDDSFDEERDDALAEALEITIQRLLTDDLRRDIVSALNTLRLRLKRSGKEEEVARVAALQSFLREGTIDAGMWSLFGLVQAIVSRSMAAGLALFSVSMELAETAPVGEDDTSLTFSQRLTQSPLVKKVDTLLRKTPGLRAYMEKQADKAWDEGMQALFAGDLYLGLFSQDELGEGMYRVAESLRVDIDGEGTSQGKALPARTQKTANTIFSCLEEYVAEICTPARLDQLRSRLDTILSDSDHLGEHLSFVLLLSNSLADDDGEEDRDWLVSAFLGESRWHAKSFEAETEGDAG